MSLEGRKKRLRRKVLTLIWSITILWLFVVTFGIYTNYVKNNSNIIEVRDVFNPVIYNSDFWVNSTHIFFNNSIWALNQENTEDFIGRVRYAKRNDFFDYPMVTHDLVIGTGEFAYPERTSIVVSNHDFSYIKRGEFLKGDFVFFHAIPIDKSVLKKVDNLKNNDKVFIKYKPVLSLKKTVLDFRKVLEEKLLLFLMLEKFS